MYPSLRLHVSVTTTPCICHYDSMYPSLRLPFPYYTSTMCVSELFLTCTSLATQSRVIIVCVPPHSLCAVPYMYFPRNTEPCYHSVCPPSLTMCCPLLPSQHRAVLPDREWSRQKHQCTPQRGWHGDGSGFQVDLHWYRRNNRESNHHRRK